MATKLKVSTYARKKKVAVQTVYAWIKDKKIKSEKVDGVIFIIE